MKLRFDFGWYFGEDFALCKIVIFEIGDADFITIFSIKIAKFLVGIHLW